MENALTQADIDALMRELLPSDGEGMFQSDGTARAYDFRRPTKFKKDLIRTLVMVHENFARLLQSFFMARLRTRSQVFVRSTNQYTFSEFVQLLPNPAVLAPFRLEPLPATCLIELSQNIAFAVIDRVFGGSGSDTQPQRGLSEIELGVINRVLMDALLPLQEAWRSVMEVKPTLDSLETNPMFLQTVAPGEVVAVVTIAVEIGEHVGHMKIVFPYAAMEPVLALFSSPSWQHQQVAESDREVLEHSLQAAPVQVSVDLGHARLTVFELASLKVGDVIPLGTKVSAVLPVYVGDKLSYLGRPGIVGNRMAVQIEHAVSETA